MPGGHLYAQLNPVRTAWSRLQDGKWENAHRILQKSLRKDSADLEANYVLSKWFFSSGNPDFQIDSAYHYVNKSIRQYDALALRDKERVQKFPIDSLILNRLKSQVDSAAFVRAKQENTEAGYLRFMKLFPTAAQLNNAIELRDEVSFLEALKVNTYLSFQSYLARYPKSHRAKEATERYEKLLFDEITKNKKLASFKSFLKAHPQSPYAGEALRQVFEISTATGEPEDFFNFLKQYGDARYKKFITDLLFHIYKEREEVIPAAILTDSLKQVMELDARFWIPFLKNGVFGFMDQTGSELLKAQFHEVRDEYKCGPVVDDILSLPDGYFSRSGKMIASSGASLHAIGAGFLEVKQQGCLQLFHKSGRIIIDECFEGYKMVDDNFIAARRGEQFILYTLTGRKLPVAGITQVDHVEGLILLTRSGKKIINTKNQLASMADGNSFQGELVFDEVMAVDKNLLLVRNSGMEGIIDDKLNYTVPLGRHNLTKTSFGLIEKQNDRISIHGLSPDLETKTFDNITYQRNWLVLYESGKVNLFDIPTKKMIASHADSVWFDQSLAFIEKDHRRKVYLSPSYAIDLEADSRINFISSRDSVQFFFTETNNRKTVFTLDKGDKLFTTEFDIVESLGRDYFIVSKGNYKGMLGRSGKLIVPVEMNEIILRDKNYLSLLKDKKFGLYNLIWKKYIKPVYERNLIPLEKQHLVVYKDGFYGLINYDAKPLTKFEFSEVQAWSDSVIWIKKDYQWKLMNYITGQIIMDQIKDFSWLRNSAREKIVRVHRENYYGIVSNTRGVVIQPTFTEIINLGDADNPFYFTEKQVEEAGIFVVIYFDKTGKLVRKQALEEEEYDKILCQD